MKIYCTKQVMGLAALSFTALSHAGTIFQTGFESTETPGYSTGQLSGRDGWSGAGNLSVATGVRNDYLRQLLCER
jgi:hypothetical protein